MKKICPKCGAEFECRHDEILNCHCATVQLSANQRERLKTLYGDKCLCHKCLISEKKKNKE